MLGEENVVIRRSRTGSLPQSQRVIKSDSGSSRILTTKVGLQLPSELSFEEWQSAGNRLSGMVSSSCWWLGDWLVYGKEHYDGRYELGARNAGLQYQTLRNYAWVARSYAVSRRRATLSFQHHQELASLAIEEQDEWLQRAEDYSWSTKQLRSAIRSQRSTLAAPPDGARSMRRLAFPIVRFRRWNQAAARAGIDLEQWMLAALDDAAERALVN